MLTDKLGAACAFDVYTPDLFRGGNAPVELITAPEGEKPAFDLVAWLGTTDVKRQISDSAALVNYLRSECGYKTIGVVGFCWGAQLVNLVTEDSTTKVDFAAVAHPSMTSEDN